MLICPAPNPPGYIDTAFDCRLTVGLFARVGIRPMLIETVPLNWFSLRSRNDIFPEEPAFRLSEFSNRIRQKSGLPDVLGTTLGNAITLWVRFPLVATMLRLYADGVSQRVVDANI